MIKNTLIGLTFLLALGCKDKDAPVNTDDTVLTGSTDGDGDGYTTNDGDCDDADGSISPDSTEICDGIDNNCDGVIDEDVTTTFYEDVDGDGFGDDGSGVEACEVPDGYSAVGGDCDDGEAEAFPGNVEYCDGVDNNCDGNIDEEVSGTWYADSDGDGYGDDKNVTFACDQPTGYTDTPGDCDDADAAYNPGAEEFCDDPNDYNCDNSVGYADVDGDGWAACLECNDDDAAINPDGTEVCDGQDNDCDGDTDEPDSLDASIWYADSDTDGFGDASTSTRACDEPSGYVADDSDCNDADITINPDGEEVCDYQDNDCDGDVDENDASDVLTWYADADGDGYGDAATTTESCSQPSGFVADSSDCDDSDAAVNPAGEEVCDGEDNDCDGTVDEDDATDALTWYADADADSYGDASTTTLACDQPSGYVADDTDCDDGNNTQYPGADEYCNGEDDDCDGDIDEAGALDEATWYADTDADAYGDASATALACDQPSGYVADSSDCDDGDAAQYPGADEYCNSEDDDCDGTIDEDDALDAATWYGDGDSDGYGNSSFTLVQCDQPSNYVDNYDDCDDSDAAINPAATEICDGADNDCDGNIDDDDSSVDTSTGTTWYADSDGDTYGGTSSVETCDVPSGYVADATDCNDADAAINPAATEVCDFIDNDCDTLIDDDDSDLDSSTGSTFYADTDTDGYGDASSTTETCSQPSGYVSDATDCDDADSAQYPGADEYCNSEDDDCDGTIDEDDALDAATWYADADADAYGDSSSTDLSCTQPSGYVADATDCDDTDAAINPAATEICDTIDNDCDTLIDDDDSDLDSSTGSTFYADSDADGYGDASSTTETCNQPSGYVTDATDCDDADSAQYPGADEYCNLEDDDCDGDVDEETIDGDWYATDDDGDGFGDPGSTAWTCDGADNEYDCNDADSGEPVVVDADIGSSSGDGSLSSPFDAIQDGIDTANECVVVYEGTYFEAINFNGQDITVTGVSGSESTSIDASGYGEPAVTFENAELATLIGFTITGGEGYHEASSSSYACTSITTCTDYIDTYAGGGIYINGADPELVDVILEANLLPEASVTVSGDDTFYVYSFGGGIFVEDGTVLFEDGSLIENSADQGGGVYLDSTSIGEVDTSFVIANTAGDGGGFQVDGGELSLTNVASMWNEGTGDGGGIFLIDAVLYATNVSQGGDDAPTGGGIYASGSSAATVMNSIIVEAGAGEGVLVGGSASFTGTYNDVYNNAGGDYSGTTDPTGSNGNISSDPLFSTWTDNSNYADDDMTLSAKSPGIDAGDPTSSYDDADGTTNDMGAWGGASSDW
ncbi:MAG: hypothetical protein ACI8RZ_000707 [Myxococcota bacterium]|jgi:hypothetical protein